MTKIVNAKGYPLVSIVIPTHNSAEYLRRTLDSIFGQKFTDYEVIVVDDCSTDSTTDILSEFNSIRVHRNKTQLGAAGSRNVGLSLARGKYISPFDSDDIMEPNCLEVQVDFMENKENSDVGVCGSNVLLIDMRDKVIGTKRFPEKHEDCKKAMFYRSPFCHSAVIIRGSIFDSYGPYIERVAHDHALWFRLAEKTRFHNIQKDLVRYRIHNTSLSSRKTRDQFRTVMEARRMYRETEGKSLPIMSELYYFIARPIVRRVPPAKLFRLYHTTLSRMNSL